MAKLILASASVRRREILSHIGLDFTAITADVDEARGIPDTPDKIVEELSLRKANAILSHSDYSTGDIIIGSDTIVYHNKSILTKPIDKDDAVRMLKELSGSCHQVYSGLCVTDGKKVVCTHAMTSVKMREISEDEIAAYVNSLEPLDKAGAYGIQDLGGIFVERIEGDYYNVVGLPLEKLCVILDRDFGYNVLEKRTDTK
ncbi:MAG: septum formation protein Maf [Ruminococcaceae bacterium]|nr:septum formation protein Maf [Oscillospiraceae bacterium]